MTTSAIPVWIHTCMLLLCPDLHKQSSKGHFIHHDDLLKLFELSLEVIKWLNIQPMGYFKLQGPGILFEST